MVFWKCIILVCLFFARVVGCRRKHVRSAFYGTIGHIGPPLATRKPSHTITLDRPKHEVQLSLDAKLAFKRRSMKPTIFPTSPNKNSFLIGLGKTVILEESVARPIAVCVSVQKLENGSIGVNLQPAWNSSYEFPCSHKGDTTDQLWGFVYTCVILSLFSFLILALMFKSLRDDDNDYMINEALQTLRCKMELDRMVYEKRLLREAKRIAQRHLIATRGLAASSGDVSSIVSEGGPITKTALVRTDSKMRRAYSCLPNIVVTVPSPPTRRRQAMDFRRRIFGRHPQHAVMIHETHLESVSGGDADDERSIFSSRGSLFT